MNSKTLNYLIVLSAILILTAQYSVINAQGDTQPYFMIGPQQPYSFIVYSESGTYYAKNAYGLIEYSGTNASLILQNALYAGIGILFLQKGDYYLPVPIDLEAKDALKGEGIGKTRLIYSGDYYQGGVIHDAGDSNSTKEYNIAVSDLSLDCNAKAQYGVHFENSVGTVERVKVTNFVNVGDWGVGIIWGWAESVYDSSAVSDETGVYIKDCIIQDATALDANPQGLVGIFLTNHWRSQVTGNIIKNLHNTTNTVVRGIQIDCTCGYVVCTHNRIEQCSAEMGIYFIAGGIRMQINEENIVAFNTIMNCKDGITLTHSGPAVNRRNQIVYNNILYSERCGIYCNEINFTNFEGNIILNPACVTQSGDHLESGILLSDSSFCIVSGNQIIDNRTSTLMEYCVHLRGGLADYNVIIGNVFYGATTSAYGYSAGTPSHTIVEHNIEFP